MKKEYDFSKGERGKFYDKDATLNMLIYLEGENLTFISAIAKRKGFDISTIVDKLISSDRKNIEIVR